MKIAVIHSFYTSQQPSGENAVVVDQVAQLQRAGHDVEMIAKYTEVAAKAALFTLRAASTTVTGWQPSPSPQLEKFAPDVIHLHNTFPNWGTSWLKQWGEKTVVTLHNYRSVCSNGLLFRDGAPCMDCLRTPVFPAIRHRCYRGSALASLPVALGAAPFGGLRRVPRQVARVIALNEDAVRFFTNVFERPIDLVPNFVDVESSPQVPPRLGWIYIGRLGQEKGIDVLLKSWPKGESLDVVGDGPLLDVVEEYAHRHDGSIRSLGLIPRHEVLRLLPRYTGLILPSMCTENLPTVILEALASGVPTVLSHHVQASGELRDAGAAAVFSPELGQDDLSRALFEVVSRSNVMREAARKVHAQKYSAAAWQSAMEAIYADVAAKGGAP